MTETLSPVEKFSETRSLVKKFERTLRKSNNTREAIEEIIHDLLLHSYEDFYEQVILDIYDHIFTGFSLELIREIGDSSIPDEVMSGIENQFTHYFTQILNTYRNNLFAKENMYKWVSRVLNYREKNVYYTTFNSLFPYVSDFVRTRQQVPDPYVLDIARLDHRVHSFLNSIVV